MDFKRKENETDFEFGLRIIKAKCENEIDLDWEEIVKLLNLSCHRDSLRKACNVTEYSSYNVMKYYEEKLQEKISDNEILSQMEEKIKELQKEKVKYQDQKREYHNYLRADARFEHLKNTLFEIVSENKYEPFDVSIIDNNTINHMVVQCSDWHCGIKEKNNWNEISVDILKDRVENYTDTIIKLIKRHEINTVHLEILGDMVNGLIHVTTRIFNEEDVISQVKTVSEMLCNMIYNISQNVNHIKIYCCEGNHGRCVANAKDSLDVENFENLISWYLQAKLSDIKNVSFEKNIYDDSIIVYNFLNETIFAVHGHQDKVGSVINDLSQMLKIFPTEIHMGHYHSYYEKEEHNVSVVVNGTLSGVDKYAKNIRRTGKPTQNIMIYNENGRECTYKVKLGNCQALACAEE